MRLSRYLFLSDLSDLSDVFSVTGLGLCWVLCSEGVDNFIPRLPILEPRAKIQLYDSYRRILLFWLKSQSRILAKALGKE